MTPNQTIDGVPRELLEKIANGLYLRRFGIDWANELRALLDAPAVSLTDEGEKPAAKPQGEPVADALSTGFYVTESGGGNYAINIGFRSMADMQAADQQLRDLLRSRHAKQPAPVAVVPEPTYRLLGDGDIIQEGDETLNDDTATWGKQPMGVFLGMPYNRRVMLPVRRATSA